MVENQIGWILINKGLEEKQAPLNDPRLAQLLQEFTNITLEELTNTLPPMRNI